MISRTIILVIILLVLSAPVICAQTNKSPWTQDRYGKGQESFRELQDDQRQWAIIQEMRRLDTNRQDQDRMYQDQTNRPDSIYLYRWK
jgi:hypothetical protein